MRVGQATGFQIAFLMFAVMLIAVPLTSVVVRFGSLTGIAAEIVNKGMHFALATALILAFPALRRSAHHWLATPIPASMQIETATVALLKGSVALATAGTLAAWFWITQGPERVESMIVNVDRELGRAFSPAGLVRVVIAVLVAPVVEELVFRGFIYRAFERRWGWFVAMIATSMLFGLYHPYAWSAFVSSIVFVCVMRRTGSMQAPILVHMAFNLVLWWPLLGQYVFPHGRVLSDPATWYLHFACIAFVLVAVPAYVWMSRDRNVVAPTVFLEPDGALSK